MKIKLISPRMSLRPMDSEYKRRLSPSMALLTVAALTGSEHEIWIEDENVKALNLEDQPDLVGITANVDTSLRAYAIADQYRLRGVPVVLGGIHVSALPDEALLHADAVCIGDAEESWPRILKDVQAGGLKGKYFQRIPPELSQTPPARWDLLNTPAYLYTNIVSASRGCPFRCAFCYNSCPYVHPHRNRPVAQVVDEILRLKTKHVMFIDDNFIGNPEWTRQFVDAIRPLGLVWNAAVSANILLHLDLLDQMQASGCRSLFIGFESINQISLDGVGKRQNRSQHFEKLVEEIHSRGMMINASLVFGLDHDGPEIFENTLDWLVSHRIESMTAHILTPYPGTVLYEWMRKENRIIDEDWSHYNTAHVVYQPKRMSVRELYNGYLWIYDQFYSLRNILARRPVDLGQWMPYFLFNLGYRKFGKLTSLLGKAGLMNGIGKTARRLAYGIG